MVSSRSDRYRVLSTTLGREPARVLIDRLQVLALTQPDALREMEVFLERGAARAPALTVHRIADRRRIPDRRSASSTPAEERRRGPRRRNESSRHE